MKTTIAAMVMTMWGAVAAADELASASAGTQAEDAQPARTFSPAVNIETVGGVKRFEKGWAFQDQQEMGVMTTLLWNADMPIGIAIDVLESGARERTAHYATAVRSREIAAGFRARFGSGRVQVVGGTGAVRLEAEAVASYPYGVIRTRQAGIGVWYEAGVRVPVRGGRFTIGADVRRTWGTASFRNGRLPMGGTHVGVTIGMKIGRIDRVGGAS